MSLSAFITRTPYAIVPETHPDDDGVWLVIGADMEVRACGDMIPQELEQILGFLDFVTNYTLRKALIDVEGFLTRDGVSANKGMLLDVTKSLQNNVGSGQDTYHRLDRFPSHGPATVARMIGLSDGRVHRLKTFQTFLELRRKAIVCFNLRSKKGISATVLGLIKDKEECGPRWLLFIRLYADN
jgi:hypothetical protein